MNVNYEGNSATGKSEWLTPPEIVMALGEFDLDPCSPVNRPWDTAKIHYTVEDDGLKTPWIGRVFCNPPYDRGLLDKFLMRCAEHKDCTALIFARTDTRFFHDIVFKNAHSILFIRGRIKFHNVDGSVSGSTGAPSVLVAFDKENGRALKESGIEGMYIQLVNEI